MVRKVTVRITTVRRTKIVISVPRRPVTSPNPPDAGHDFEQPCFTPNEPHVPECPGPQEKWK